MSSQLSPRPQESNLWHFYSLHTSQEFYLTALTGILTGRTEAAASCSARSGESCSSALLQGTQSKKLLYVHTTPCKNIGLSHDLALHYCLCYPSINHCSNLHSDGYGCLGWVIHTNTKNNQNSNSKYWWLIMKDVNFFRNITEIFSCNFSHFLSVKGWKDDVLVASNDYTIRFSAISSKIVVSDWEKDHEV